MKNWQQPFVMYRLFLCVLAFLLIGSAPVLAQTIAGGIDTIGNRGGVLVDANGVLSRFFAKDFGKLSRQQLNAAKASYSISQDVTAKSPMRCVALNRLEKIVEANGILTDEMKYLAGIQRITYVFYFPESKDIVIAGPAEGWFPGYEGAMIGTGTQQPVCELQHLVTALRAYAPGGDRTGIVGCSIDPTQEGNARLQQFQAQAGNMTPRDFVRGVRESLGMQTIRVDGIPATAHAAQIMVAADYRMKRIGLGMDDLRVSGLKTFIANTVPTNRSNALFRWYFVPDYECVVLTEDRNGMELVGEGVKLVGENEVVSSTGERTVTEGPLDPGSAAFTKSFTGRYPQIAKQALVFAQLRNWIDMLICAAHIQREDFYGKSGWTMTFFGNEEKFSLEICVAPKEVEPIVGERLMRELVLAPVGGIAIDAEVALDEEHAKPDTNGKIANKQNQIALALPEDVWWWDAK
ncbi:MAG: DUF1598 domain-containing protein [Planctomycetaceae bacterium]|jgi:hypothetical protein|nr:DUF1598 domain-containing protein [Planctomycetaceae bacterium]